MDRVSLVGGGGVVILVDVPAGVAQDFSTFLLRCLPSFLSRERFSRPFPPSTVTSNFMYPLHQVNRSTLAGHDARKNPSSCDCAETETYVPTSEGFEVTY